MRIIKKIKNGGFTFIEAMIAVSILALVSLGILRYIQSASMLMMRSHDQLQASKLSQEIFTTLNNIPYFYVFAFDSSDPDFGLTGSFGAVGAQTTLYPYLADLYRLKSYSDEWNFVKFAVDVEFMVRDTSDLDGDGEVTDLRPYEDEDGDDIDDYEPGICYHDQNFDGDYQDYYGAEPYISEEPNTRIKKVTLRIYKKTEVIFQETQLISLEKFSGEAGQAGGAELTLLVSTPTQNSVVFSSYTTGQQAAWDLDITRSYPADNIAFRADAYEDLYMAGRTDPVADVSFRLKTATAAVLDTVAADIAGDFTINAAGVTANLREGTNYIWGRATKGSAYSPWSKREIIYDLKPPTIRDMNSTGTVRSLQPYIYVRIVDEPVAAGRAVSDVCEEILDLKRNGMSVDYDYDASTGIVAMINSGSGLPPVLGDGMIYTMKLEGGDNAHYKSSAAWTFTCNIIAPDGTPPVFTDESPTGTTGVNPPTISCTIYDDQSGVRLSSVTVTLDGLKVVSETNIGSYCTYLEDHEGITINYTPSNNLGSGNHPVVIRAVNWAGDQGNKNWSFNVP
ncbi:MAG: prepilin-type N-terminal cleavage/methylation domain-containing protein [Elusimicrobia bacterium]|nr:prepilin-type N-terminal cleavage/methylation domain-containing protein [Elusimicrobiota bacterium]